MYKTSPSCWNKKIHLVLFAEVGFVRSDRDPYFYVHQSNNGVMMISLYVDDLFQAGKSRKQIAWMKQLLSSKFHMKDLGEGKVYLRLEIRRDREQRSSTSPNNLTWKILDRFGMGHIKAASTPM